MASAQSFDAVDLFAIRHAAIRPWPGCIFPHTPVISALQASTPSLRRSDVACALPAVSPNSYAHFGLILSSWACMQWIMRPSPGVTLLQYFLISEAQVFSSFVIFAVSFSTIVFPRLVCADADPADKITSKGKT